MESFIERYQKICREAGLTKEHMAKLLDMSVTGVEAIETGYIEPNEKILLRLSDIFNVSAGYMATLTDDPKCEEEYNAKEVYILSSLWGDNGIITIKDIVGTAFVNRNETKGKDYCALVMKDDSMVKSRIYKDDVLIVKRQAAASNGDVVVVLVEDEELVRRYHRKGNYITLSAEGDSFKYKTIKIDETETKFKILGKVCEVRIKNI